LINPESLSNKNLLRSLHFQNLIQLHKWRASPPKSLSRGDPARAHLKRKRSRKKKRRIGMSPRKIPLLMKRKPHPRTKLKQN
jgi:hypothetical protein